MPLRLLLLAVRVLLRGLFLLLLLLWIVLIVLRRRRRRQRRRLLLLLLLAPRRRRNRNSSQSTNRNHRHPPQRTRVLPRRGPRSSRPFVCFPFPSRTKQHRWQRTLGQAPQSRRGSCCWTVCCWEAPPAEAAGAGWLWGRY